MNRRAFQFVAVFLGLALLGTVAVMAYLGRPKPARRVSDTPAPSPVDSGVTDSSALGGDVQSLVALGRQGVWNAVDPDTGKLQYRLMWETLDPQADGDIVLTSPAAWIVIDGEAGESPGFIVATAPSARLRWPSRDTRPESGQLQGGVAVRYFPAEQGVTMDDDAGLPRSAASLPDARIRLAMNSLRFESTLNEVSTPDPLTVTGRGIAFEGTGLLLRMSERREGERTVRRLQYARIAQGSFIEVTPAEFSAGERAAVDERTEAGSEPGKVAAQGGGAGGVRVPTIEGYVLSLKDAVKVESQGLSLSGDEAWVWARLVDGQLPRDAVGADLLGGARDGGARGDRAGPAARTGNESTADESRGPIRLTWTGPLEVRQADEAPELSSEQVAARFASRETGGVVAQDQASGASARADTLEYGATSMSLRLASGEARGVVVGVPQAGQVRCAALALSLRTGEGRIESAGEASAADEFTGGLAEAFENQGPGRGAVWTRDAMFTLKRDEAPEGDRDAIYPARLALSGSVAVFDGGSSLSGETIETAFVRAGVGDARETMLSRVAVAGGAAAVGDDGAELRAPTLEAELAPAPDGGSRLASLRADGGVVVSRPVGEPADVPTAVRADGDTRARERVEAFTLTATFVKPRRIEVGDRVPEEEERADRLESIDLDRAVRIVSADGVRVEADRVTGSPEAGTYELVGAPFTIARDGDDGLATYTLSAMQARADAVARTFTVFGEGNIDYARADGDSAQGSGPGMGVGPLTGEAQTAQLAWTGAMLYDEVRGFAEFMGDVDARSASSRGEEQRARGARLQIDFVPPGSSGVASTDADGLARTFGAGADGESAVLDRVTGVTLEGGMVNDVPDAPATVESRWYRAAAAVEADDAPDSPDAGPDDGAPERRLDALVYLAGPVIEGDAVRGTLRVPDAGTLLVEDRRPMDDAGSNADDAARTATASDTIDAQSPIEQFGDSRGTTLFTWKGDMLLERAAAAGQPGTGTMTRGVRVRHRPAGDEQLTDVVCERLSAQFLETRSADAQGGAASMLELTAVEARDGVLVNHRNLQVVCDLLLYTAAQRTLRASATVGNRVTLFDREAARHADAEAFTINMDTGEWASENMSAQGVGGGQ